MIYDAVSQIESVSVFLMMALRCAAACVYVADYMRFYLAILFINLFLVNSSCEANVVLLEYCSHTWIPDSLPIDSNGYCLSVSDNVSRSLSYLPGGPRHRSARRCDLFTASSMFHEVPRNGVSNSTHNGHCLLADGDIHPHPGPGLDE